MKVIKHLLSFALLGGMLASCQQNVEVTAGRIKSIDTETSMTLQVGEYEVEVNTSNAIYSNGSVLPKDSVNVFYVGNIREKKIIAVDVALVPPPPAWVENKVDTTKELITAPKDSLRPRMKLE